MADKMNYGRVSAGDCYETPEWALEALLKREAFEGEVLEPCSGRGAICRVLNQYGYNVKASDIREGDEIYGEQGIDAFKIEIIHDNIITNPPYSTVTKMVEHFTKIYKRKMALLLRLNFLESQIRHTFFITHPLKVIYIFSTRLSMYAEGSTEPSNGGTIAYAWFVWEKGYVGAPSIKWLSEKPSGENIGE
nr:NAD(P)-dependent oxidoreductase [uncultured Niameybacter sp.]